MVKRAFCAAPLFSFQVIGTERKKEKNTDWLDSEQSMQMSTVSVRGMDLT
jgi:hypothetical protein